MMIRIILEFRFFIDENNNLYTDSSFPTDFWKRYLQVFSEVQIVARAKRVTQENVSADWHMISDEKISFYPIPYYQGFSDLLQNLPKVVSSLNQLDTNATYIFRMPSILAVLLYFFNRKIFKSAYGVEVVGDAEEVSRTMGGLYKWIGRQFVKITKSIIANAKAAAYVERRILPVKYPIATNTRYYFSSIDLPDTFYPTGEKTFSAEGQTLKLISIGSLDQLYKGPDLLLEAIQQCKANGMSVQLKWLGGGRYMDHVVAMAKEFGLQENVSFLGVVSDKEELVSHLDNSDVFVLASRTEGLPRAMIEAMARGLPCIGANVGGIPELIESDYLFDKENVPQLFDLIRLLYNKRSKLPEMSKANIAVAGKYANSVLDNERQQFYREISNR